MPTPEVAAFRQSVVASAEMMVRSGILSASQASGRVGPGCIGLILPGRDARLGRPPPGRRVGHGRRGSAIRAQGSRGQPH